MRAMGWTSRVGVAIAMAAPLLLASCGGDSEDGAAAASLDAAIVPGADLVVRVDVEALRNAPIFASLESTDDPAAPDASEADADESDPLDGERFLEVTGLTPDDLVSVLISADLDEIDLDSDSPEGKLDRVAGAAGLRLSRALDLETLEKGLRESIRGDAPPTITRLEVSGTPALRIESSNPKEPDVFVASVAGGHTLFAAPDEQSLAGALERAASGDFAAISADLEQVHAALPAAAQGRVGFVVPQKFRDAIAGQLDEPSPGNAMMAGFAAPFRNLRSLSFGVQAAQTLTVVLAADLGAEDAAQQAQGLLGGMLAPMAKGALAEALGRAPAEVDDRVQVSAKGQALDITLRVTAEDIAAYREKQAAKAVTQE